MKIEEVEMTVQSLVAEGRYQDALAEVGKYLIEFPWAVRGYAIVRTHFQGTEFQAVCHQSHIAGYSDELQRLLIGSLPGPDFFSGRALERICHEPASVVPRSPDIDITPRIPHSYRSEMKSNATSLHIIEPGTVWFDRFNMVVYDKNGACVKNLCKGNIFIADAASKNAKRMIHHEKIIVIGTRSEHNYYHWIFDIMPKFQILREAGVDYRDPSFKLVFGRVGRPMHGAFLERLGIDESQIVETAPADQTSVSLISADTILFPWLSNEFGRKMGAWVPEFIRSLFPVESLKKPASRKLFLARRPETARNGRQVINNSEVEQFFLQQGFDIIYPDSYSVPEQAELMASATHVAAVHGAALTNICFCRPNTHVLELYGAFYDVCFWSLAEVCGLIYYSFSCTFDPEDPDFMEHFADYVLLNERSNADLKVPLHRLAESRFIQSIDPVELAG